MEAIASGTSPCAHCGGSGFEWREGKGARPCRCKAAERAARLVERARIPNRFKDCSFDNFESVCTSAARALAASRQFAEMFPAVDVGLLYLGSCGLGKTHLAVATLRQVVAGGVNGLFYDFRDLLKEIQDSYNSRTHASELKILKPVFEADLLVLDELGASVPTEWVRETVSHIVNARYNDKKVTIFTSNYLDVAAGSHAEMNLTDRVGVRLRSRLHEMCRRVFIEGDDYRKLGRASARECAKP